MSSKDQWTAVKQETGQVSFVTPQMIKEKDKYYTKKSEIADSMNRQFLGKICQTLQSIPESQDNPIDNYKKSIRPNLPTFNFKIINMSELRKVISSMAPTASTAQDQISMRSIIQARNQIEPQLLNLINRIIITAEYPTDLKLTKIILIPKSPKDITLIDGWRPINIVPAISKIIEKTLMRQMLSHLVENNVVDPNHHQTLVVDLHDKLVQDMEAGEDVALLLLNQSKAYNLVPHKILIQKMEVRNHLKSSRVTSEIDVSMFKLNIAIQRSIQSELDPSRKVVL